MGIPGYLPSLGTRCSTKLKGKRRAHVQSQASHSQLGTSRNSDPAAFPFPSKFRSAALSKISTKSQLIAMYTPYN